MADDRTDVERDMARLDYEAGTAEAAERVKHQIALVDRGLQGLMLINGGALVALFTLLGGSLLHVSQRYLWTGFGLFALGLALSLGANLAAFLSQGAYYAVTQFQAWDAQRRMHGLAPERADAVLAAYRRGAHAELAGIAAAVLSLLAFIVGCGLALAGVTPA